MKNELSFSAKIEIIGINPFVFIPVSVLEAIFEQSGKTKGHIPVKGTVNGKEYKQTLVKYKGSWRFYVNTQILENSPKRIGETIEVTIAYDPTDRTVAPHPKLIQALHEDKQAKTVFEALPKSRRQEIIKYISYLKTEESIDRNIGRIIDFLNGKARFAGRDKP